MDFKHKKTGEALWLDDQKNQPWVAAEMSAMAPGIMQLHPFAWNGKLTKYVKDGQLEKVVQLFQHMQLEGMTPDKFTFVQAIKACAGLRALEDGRLVQSGCESVSLWEIAWLTCMQNVGAFRRLGECSTRCHLKMWSLGAP